MIYKKMYEIKYINEKLKKNHKYVISYAYKFL